MKLFSNQVIALAALSIKEVYRKKTFLIVGIFAIALLGSSVFFHSVDSESRLRLLELWAIRTMVLLSAILAIFVTGFSLPQDIEKRRIHNLVSKPVYKMAVVLGKLVGFSVVAFISLMLMCIASLIFIYVLKLVYGDGFPPLLSMHEREAKRPIIVLEGQGNAFVFYNFKNVTPETSALKVKVEIGHETDQSYASTKLRLKVHDHILEEHFQNNESKIIEIPPEFIIDNKLSIGMARTDTKSKVFLTGESCVLNKTLPSSFFIGGKGNPHVIYIFEKVPPNPPAIKLKMQISHETDQFSYSTKISVKFQGRVLEEHLLNNENKTINIPIGSVKEDKLRVEILRTDPLTRIELTNDSCLIRLSSEPFAFNFFKGTILVFFQAVLVLAICLAGTTLFHATTSIMLATLVFLICNLHSFIQESSFDVEREIKKYQIEAGGKQGSSPYGMPVWMLQVTSAVNYIALQIFPDFGKIDPTRFFLEDIAIKGDDIIDGFMEVMLRVLPVLILASIFITLRDFSA